MLVNIAAEPVPMSDAGGNRSHSQPGSGRHPGATTLTPTIPTSWHRPRGTGYGPCPRGRHVFVLPRCLPLGGLHSDKLAVIRARASWASPSSSSFSAPVDAAEALARPELGLWPAYNLVSHRQ